MVRIISNQKLKALKDENQSLREKVDSLTKQKKKLQRNEINIQHELSITRAKLHAYKEKEFKAKAKSLGIDHESMAVSDFQRYQKLDTDLFGQMVNHSRPIGSMLHTIFEMARVDHVGIDKEMTYLIERANLHNSSIEQGYLGAMEASKEYHELLRLQRDRNKRDATKGQKHAN